MRESVYQVSVTEQPESINPRGFYALLAAVMLCLFVLHAAKGWGDLPLIFPDETNYSFDARLRTFSEAMIPNYLFYLLYRVAAFWGESFLDAVRVLNAFFFVAAGPFIYLLARRGCGPRLSLVIMTLSLLSPISAYTHYFIAEPPYFFFFWALVWAAVRWAGLPPIGYAVLLGCMAGLLSLVKVHAVFLLPGFWLYFLVTRPSIAASLASAAAAAAAFAAVKFSLAYSFAGPAGLTVLGSAYAGEVSQGLTAFAPAEFAASSVYNLLGHAQAIILLYGPALLCMLPAIFRRAEKDPESSGLHRFSLLILCLLAGLAAMTALFAAYNDYIHFSLRLQESGRLQSRFYNFLYPAFLIAGGWSLSLSGQQNSGPRPAARMAMGMAAAAVILAAVLTDFQNYNIIPSLRIDCPEYLSFFTFIREEGMITRHPVYALCGAAAAACLLWGLCPRKGLVFYLCLVLPAYSLFSLKAYQLDVFGSRRGEDLFSRTSREVKNFLGPETALLSIMTDGTAASYQFAFYIDDKNAGIIKNKKGEKYIDPSRIKPGSRWILLFSYASVPEELVRMRFDFGEPFNPGLHLQLVRIADFTFSAGTGRESAAEWPLAARKMTDSDITLTYAIALPQAMRIALDFGGDPPAGGSFTVSAGGNSYALTADTQPAYTVTAAGAGNVLRLQRTGNVPWPSRIDVMPLREEAPAPDSSGTEEEPQPGP